MLKMGIAGLIALGAIIALTGTPTQAGSIWKGVGKNMTLIEHAKRKRARSLCWDDFCDRCCIGKGGKTFCIPICM